MIHFSEEEEEEDASHSQPAEIITLSPRRHFMGRDTHGQKFLTKHSSSSSSS